ncbi:hypothetical protein TIFTF001_010077 [Ficus carica]|uniref:Uncharacterized protein n=1 Tax=Ficus carica TaxID=3494 RepID=A0AA88CZH8_FICCA|nr:hypothetical protein TIFTF001_010077 [Ficus carica]
MSGSDHPIVASLFDSNRCVKRSLLLGKQRERAGKKESIKQSRIDDSTMETEYVEVSFIGNRWVPNRFSLVASTLRQGERG